MALAKKSLEDPADYPPALKYIYHDLLYSHFGFPPEQFVRSAGDSVNFCLYDATERLQEMLREKYGAKDDEKFQTALSQIETLVESRVDSEFDKFEIYVLRNGFRFPLNLLPYLRLEHHPPFPSTSTLTTQATQTGLYADDVGAETEDQVMREIEEEVRLLKEAKDKELKLRELKRVLNVKVSPLKRLKEELESIKPPKNVKADKKALVNSLAPLIQALEQLQLQGDQQKETNDVGVKSNKEVVNERLGERLEEGINYTLEQ